MIEEYIKNQLEYSCGQLYWKNSYFKSKIGQPVADITDSNGYKLVKVKGKLLKQHRVVWFLHKGVWPEGWLDHIDRDKSNNDFENLREVSFSQSNANRSKSKNEKASVYKGVSKYRNSWKATCQGLYLGTFKTEREAALAYDKKAKQVWNKHAKLNLEHFRED